MLFFSLHMFGPKAKYECVYISINHIAIICMRNSFKVSVEAPSYLHALLNLVHTLL